MERSIAFYRDVLGLTATYTSPYWSEFQVGQNRLGLHPKLKSASEPLGIYEKGWFLGIACSDLKALREKLDGAGAKIHGDYHAVPGGVVLDFVDPDGNTLEAFQEGAKLQEFR